MCKIATVKENDNENEKLCPGEVEILIAFYKAFNGTGWINNELWLDETRSFCSWYGVVCDKEGTSVIKLELANNSLSGMLGNKMLRAMQGFSRLESLNLNGNNITVCFNHQVTRTGCTTLCCIAIS